jgi:hypothetical protein
MIERVLAAAMFAHDAPRVGNDHQDFNDLEGHEQRRFLSYAKIAMGLLANVKLASEVEKHAVVTST